MGCDGEYLHKRIFKGFGKFSMDHVAVAAPTGAEIHTLLTTAAYLKEYWHGKCTNPNSISSGLCAATKNSVCAVGRRTVPQAIELAKALMKKYNIPVSYVIRHFDVTGKLCPAYWADKESESKWESEFRSKLTEPDYRA